MTDYPSSLLQLQLEVSYEKFSFYKGKHNSSNSFYESTLQCRSSVIQDNMNNNSTYIVEIGQNRKI